MQTTPGLGTRPSDAKSSRAAPSRHPILTRSASEESELPISLGPEAPATPTRSATSKDTSEDRSCVHSVLLSQSEKDPCPEGTKLPEPPAQGWRPETLGYSLWRGCRLASTADSDMPESLLFQPSGLQAPASSLGSPGVCFHFELLCVSGWHAGREFLVIACDSRAGVEKQSAVLARVSDWYAGPRGFPRPPRSKGDEPRRPHNCILF